MVAEVYCPGELDLGGNVVNLYTHNDDNQWHHEWSDMKYIFELEDCSRHVEPTRISRVNGPIETGRCIFVVAAEFDNKGVPLALQTDVVDQYAPRKTGVYNVQLGPWTGTSSKVKEQQWIYDVKD